MRQAELVSLEADCEAPRESGRGVKGAARTLRDETAGRLRRRIAVVWSAVFLLGIMISALLCSLWLDEAGFGALVLCWSSLLVTLSASVAGWIRGRRKPELRRLVKENLLENYREIRKDLEVWLSARLIGDRAEMVRRLVEVRLDRRLARRRRKPLARGPFLAMFLLVGAFLLLMSLHVRLGISPWKSADRYVRGLFARRAEEEAPAIVGLYPSGRWVRAGELEELEVVFHRKVSGDARLLVHSKEGTETRPLEPLSEIRYRASVPPQEGRVSIQVAVDELRSPVLEYHIYPYEPVAVVAVRVFDSRGRELGTFDPERSPFSLPQGGAASFELRVAQCPLVAFGLGGSATRGELGLREERPGGYAAEVRLLEDESFRAFWQLPGAAAEIGPDLSFRVESAPAPEVRLLLPQDGVRPGRRSLVVACRSDSRGRAGKGFLLCADYHGMEWAWEFPVRRYGGGEWGARFELPVDTFRARSGRIIGFCVAMQSDSGPEKTGYSDVANVILPLPPDPDALRTTGLPVTPTLGKLRIGSVEMPFGDSAVGKNCATCGAQGAGGGTCPFCGGTARRPGRGSGGGQSPGGGTGAYEEAQDPRGGGGSTLAPVPEPPRYSRSGIPGSVGRKIRAERVEGNPAGGPQRRRSRGKESDLSAGDTEIVKEGRRIAGRRGGGTPRSGRGRRRLSTTEMEKRISRYDSFMDRLTAEERRAVREFHRRLRDLR